MSPSTQNSGYRPPALYYVPTLSLLFYPEDGDRRSLLKIFYIARRRVKGEVIAARKCSRGMQHWLGNYAGTELFRMVCRCGYVGPWIGSVDERYLEYESYDG